MLRKDKAGKVAMKYLEKLKILERFHFTNLLLRKGLKKKKIKVMIVAYADVQGKMIQGQKTKMKKKTSNCRAPECGHNWPIQGTLRRVALLEWAAQ